MPFRFRYLLAVTPLAALGTGLLAGNAHGAPPSSHCHSAKWCTTTTTTQPVTTTTTQPPATTTTTTQPPATTTTTTQPAATTSGTSTEPPPPPGFTSSQLVFNDTFSGPSIDQTKWNTYMTSKAANGWPWFGNGQGGSAIGSSGGNYLDYDQPGQVTTGTGLSLAAQNDSSQSGYPWTSGVISTYGHFELDGGYVQVRAKVPTADGDWPAIWMLPGPGASTTTDNYEIDIFEGGMTGAAASSTIDSYHVHQGTAQWGGNYDTGVDLSNAYHTYGVDWVPGQSITWYFDGQQIAQVTSAEFSIPDEPMELIINNGIAGTGTTGWHSQVDSATGSTSTLSVSSVQAYS